MRRLALVLVRLTAEHGAPNTFACAELDCGVFAWRMTYGRIGKHDLAALNTTLADLGANCRVSSYNAGRFTTGAKQ